MKLIQFITPQNLIWYQGNAKSVLIILGCEKIVHTLGDQFSLACGDLALFCDLYHCKIIMDCIICFDIVLIVFGGYDS